MEHTFYIDVTGLQIDNYEEYLSKFPGWLENKRDINLNLVLSEESKIQFDVEIDNSQSVKYVSLLDKDFDVSSLKSACGVIQKFTFIISKKSLISLKVVVKFLNTHYGKILKELLKSEIYPELCQYKNEKEQITNFYFFENKIAA